jgi:hypothetical protein
MSSGPPKEDLASLNSIRKIREQDLTSREEKKKKRKGPLLIHEHVGLDQADKEERKRKRSHPTTGSTPSIPDGWRTTGGRVPQPKDIEG